MHSPDQKADPAGGMSYTLDEADTIVAVNGSWDDFARNNEGEQTVARHIIGKKLDQFIHGDETRMFVRTMIMSARVLKKPIYRPYRCDSPQHKRFMEMTVFPRAEGQVEVVHRELHREPIFRPVRFTAAPLGASTAYVKRCSLCNRVQAQGLWSELEEALETERLQMEASTLKVFYGVCPDCLRRRGVAL